MLYACGRSLTLRSQCFTRACLPLAGDRTVRVQCLHSCQAASSDGGGGGGKREIAPPDVRELARMAHITLTEAEVADWGPKIESIVDWFGQLQDVDVEGILPAVRADVDGQHVLRPDVVRRPEGQADLLQQAPDREGSFVRVPKIATAADD